MFKNIWHIRCRACGAKGRVEADIKELATNLAKAAHRDGRLDCLSRKLCPAGPMGNLILMHPRFCWVVVVGDTGKLPGHKRDYEGIFKAAFVCKSGDKEDPEGLKWAKEFVRQFMLFIDWQPYHGKPTELYNDNQVLTKLEWEREGGEEYIAIKRKFLNPLNFEH